MLVFVVAGLLRRPAKWIVIALAVTVAILAVFAVGSVVGPVVSLCVGCAASAVATLAGAVLVLAKFAVLAAVFAGFVFYGNRSLEVPNYAR